MGAIWAQDASKPAPRALQDPSKPPRAARAPREPPEIDFDLLRGRLEVALLRGLEHVGAPHELERREGTAAELRDDVVLAEAGVEEVVEERELRVLAADDDVQREWERRGCLVDGGDGVVAASRFTPVHLELRKGYDEYIGDYIDANWEANGGGGGDASLRRDLRSPVRLELAVDGASGAVGAALSYRAPRVRPPRVEKGAVRLSLCTTTAGRVWAVLELRASAFRARE